MTTPPPPQNAPPTNRTTNRLTFTSSILATSTLLLCLVATSLSSIYAEALLDEEPSLRGLVHVGVMGLFAWICVEPYCFFFFGRGGGVRGERRTVEDCIPTDSQGMGIVFSGFGLFYLSLLPLLVSASGYLFSIDCSSNRQQQQLGGHENEREPTLRDANPTMYRISGIVGLFLITLSYVVTAPVVRFPPPSSSSSSPTAAVFPPPPPSSFHSDRYRTILTMALCLLGGALSLIATIRMHFLPAILPSSLLEDCALPYSSSLVFADAAAAEFDAVPTQSTTSSSSSSSWTILLLDYMAYVFHRAFIATLLVGGGCFSRTTTIDRNDNDNDGERKRWELRRRYRSYFCFIAWNLGLSWILCGASSISDSGRSSMGSDEWWFSLSKYSDSSAMAPSDDGHPHNHPYHHNLLILAGLSILTAGILQTDRLYSFFVEQQQRRTMVGGGGGGGGRWSWGFIPPHARNGTIRIASVTPTSNDATVTAANRYRYYSTIFYYTSITFYAVTLFISGIIINNNDAPHRDEATGETRNSNTVGFDECLTRSVHVAAVFATMVAIFPRFLTPTTTPPTGSNSNNRRERRWNIYNVGLKLSVASMSTIDVIICLSLLSSTGVFVVGGGDGYHRTIVLWLRALGAVLQAASFALLDGGWVGGGGGAPSSYTSATVITARKTLLVMDEGSKQSIVGVGPIEEEGRGGGGENDDEDIVSPLIWSFYLIIHVWYSFILTNHPSGDDDDDGRGRFVPPAETQLSKIFHFQIVTLGFATTSIFRRDEGSIEVTAVFLLLEVMGVVGCTVGPMDESSFFLLGDYRTWMIIASGTMFIDCIRQKFYHPKYYLDAVSLEKKDLKLGGGGGAGAMLFPS